MHSVQQHPFNMVCHMREERDCGGQHGGGLASVWLVPWTTTPCCLNKGSQPPTHSVHNGSGALPAHLAGITAQEQLIAVYVGAVDVRQRCAASAHLAGHSSLQRSQLILVWQGGRGGVCSGQ
jgi:hypothetical protein